MLSIEMLYSHIWLENVYESNYLWKSKKNTSDYDSIYPGVKKEIGKYSLLLLEATEYIVVNAKILKPN